MLYHRSLTSLTIKKNVECIRQKEGEEKEHSLLFISINKRNSNTSNASLFILVNQWENLYGFLFNLLRVKKKKKKKRITLSNVILTFICIFCLLIKKKFSPAQSKHCLNKIKKNKRTYKDDYIAQCWGQISFLSFTIKNHGRFYSTDKNINRYVCLARHSLN